MCCLSIRHGAQYCIDLMFCFLYRILLSIALESMIKVQVNVHQNGVVQFGMAYVVLHKKLCQWLLLMC